MGLKEPKTALAGLLIKIKRRVTNAVKKSNLMSLCEEVTDLSWDHCEVVGPICDLHGITPTWLKEETPLASDVKVTKGIIAELFQYRRRNAKDITWRTVANEWWKKLFPGCDTIPNSSTIQTNWTVVDSTRQLLIRDSTVEAKDKFLSEEYSLPKSKPRKCEDSEPLYEDEPQQDLADVSTCSSDAGYDSASDSECSLSPYMLRRHGDTIAILHEMLEQEKQERATIDEQLKETQEKCKLAENCAAEAQIERDASQVALKKMQKETKKQTSKYERELKKATELSEKLQHELSSLQKSNVVRRLAKREAQLELEKEKVSKLEEEVEQLNNVVKELRRKKKNKTEQVR